MRNKLRPIGILTLREVRDQLRDWRIIFPTIVLTLIFPGLMNFTANQALKFVATYQAGIVGERIVPFLMMMVGFFPISVSLVIALESFVGEKERRSIEPLLSSPLQDWQLYISKLLAALILPMMTSYLGTFVFLYGVYRQVGWTPPPVLLTQVLILVAVQATVMISGAVVISAQTTSIRAANLLASFIILPMALLIQGESVAMFWANYEVLWWSIFGQIIVAGMLIRMGLAHFNREELLGREIDTLNLRWAWKTFSRQFAGSARSWREWARVEIPQALKSNATPSIVMLAVFLGGLFFGYVLSFQFPNVENEFTKENLYERFQQGLSTASFAYAGNIPAIWLQNLRAILIATILGIFTVSALGVIVIMLPAIVIGFIIGLALRDGFSPWLLLSAFVLPHGILEIPALTIAGGAILRVGASLIIPARGKTIGDSLLSTLADWVKIMLVIVAPLMLGAAIIEVLITPQVALYLLGH